MSASPPEIVAAIDLGSNSFHMLVARFEDERLQVLDRMKDMVRLAAGLDERNRLAPEAMHRAIDCLERFGQRLREFAPERVRAVGTNTLRKARNSEDFLRLAEASLGHRIDIIPGHEEARLIYLGVSHSIEDNNDTRLVMDIGGGSTEVILGQHFRPHELESLYIGCVGMSNRFFADGRITAERLRRARLAAWQEFETIEARYREAGWQSAFGASGTIIAIRDVVLERGWSSDGITPESLEALEAAMVEAGSVERLGFSALDAQRAPVFPGGVAILSAAFRSLGINRMRVSSGALREGLLYDLLGRYHQHDVREHTVRKLLERFKADAGQAERVAATAAALLAQAAERWDLDERECGRLLRWAAMLHEIGLDVSHSAYHKHGSYLLRNLYMPGFSRGEQAQLALLVRAHRRKFPDLAQAGLPDGAERRLQHMATLLRLAVVLHRSRSEAALPPVALRARDSGLRLRFPEGWLDAHPLTRADLAQEADYLKAAGIKLKLR